MPVRHARAATYNCRKLRQSFEGYLLADGYDIRTVQDLVGHKDVRTTMIYTHVLNCGERGVRSPAGGLRHRPRWALGRGGRSRCKADDNEATNVCN